VESSLYPAIALTEGVPDFLSAFHLALAFGVDAVVAPVCMSGVSVSIPGDVLPRFSGKRIRIFAHNDEAGQAAAERWTEQLKDIATVDRFTFQGLDMSDGKPVKDLNDLLSIGSDSYRKNAKLIDSVMRFYLPYPRGYFVRVSMLYCGHIYFVYGYCRTIQQRGRFCGGTRTGGYWAEMKVPKSPLSICPISSPLPEILRTYQVREESLS
jgi:hypothetical protein